MGQLLLQGYLSLDFGITAYATNTYLKACGSKLAQLLQGGNSVVVARSGGGGQLVGRAGSSGGVMHVLLACPSSGKLQPALAVVDKAKAGAIR